MVPGGVPGVVPGVVPGGVPGFVPGGLPGGVPGGAPLGTGGYSPVAKANKYGMMLGLVEMKNDFLYNFFRYFSSSSKEIVFFGETCFVLNSAAVLVNGGLNTDLLT